MKNNIEIKLVDTGNYTESSMDSFDRFQEVRNVYRIENGRLVLKNHPFTESWSFERRREKAAEILSGRYVVSGRISIRYGKYSTTSKRI